jgi:hypothetical protein
MNQGSEQKSANREKNGDYERWRMRLPQREESRCQTSQVKNACANKGEQRSGQVVCGVRAGVGPAVVAHVQRPFTRSASIAMSEIRIRRFIRIESRPFHCSDFVLCSQGF